MEEEAREGADTVAGIELSGNFAHTIDPKGRVTVPSAYREALSKGFTIGLNNEFTAVALYPAEKWAEKCERLSRIPDSDKLGTRYARLIIGSSFSGCELDAQGRVLVPLPLRQKAGLDKTLRFVGLGQYCEIWDEERYLRECESSEESIDELLAHVNRQYDQ